MKTKLLIAFIACLIAGSATAQIDLSMKKNPIYVVTPIHVTSDQKHEQRTFAAMRAPLIKKVSENPKVQVVEDRACVNKLLTVIQNLKKFTQRDSTNGKVYYKLEFHYALAIKNTETEPAAEVTPEVTPEATPEPTSAPDFGDMIRQLISSFVQSLFGSISRLFG